MSEDQYDIGYRKGYQKGEREGRKLGHDCAAKDIDLGVTKESNLELDRALRSHTYYAVETALAAQVQKVKEWAKNDAIKFVIRKNGENWPATIRYDDLLAFLDTLEETKETKT